MVVYAAEDSLPAEGSTSNGSHQGDRATAGRHARRNMPRWRLWPAINFGFLLGVSICICQKTNIALESTRYKQRVAPYLDADNSHRDDQHRS